MENNLSLKSALIGIWSSFNSICEFLQPIGDLFIRFWVAKAFFLSGLSKIQSWGTTLMLFQYEYQVPLISPELAAYCAVFIELVMSFLVLIGLGGRVPALILFLFNIAAVVSYSFLWTQAGYVGLKDHICWGLLLMVLVLHGSGILSVDQLILTIFKRKKAQNL